MKTIILFLFLFAFSLLSCQKNRVVVSGSIGNARDTVLQLAEVNVYDSKPLDSVRLGRRGRFRFSFAADAPGFYQLKLPKDLSIALFPKPGDHIRVTADYKDLLPSLVMEGSDDTQQLLKLVRNLNATKAALDSLGALFETAGSDSARQRLSSEYAEKVESHRKFSVAFILTHYNSLASLYALYQQFQPGSYVFYKNTDLQYFKIVSDSLSKYYPASKHVISLKAFTDNMISQYNSNLLMQLARNAEEALPEIALPNIANDTVTLASLKGKYVLINFWASWSDASMEQNAELIKIYNQYKNKGFEVLAVSFDTSVDSWTRAIKYDELYWINLIDERYPRSPVAVSYNVTELPCTYLVDRDNVSILGKNFTPAQLQARLAELLK